MNGPGPSTDLFTCSHCADQFKREDHLRRHELSHQVPKFKCPQEGCEKAFHRNDVLKRHLLVHRPSVNKSQRAGRKRVASRKTSNSRAPAVKDGQVSSAPQDRPNTLATPPGNVQMLGSWNLSIGPFYGATDQFDGIAHAAINQWHLNDTFVASAGQQTVAKPTFASSSYCVQMCVDRAVSTFLARFPFVHNSTLESEDVTRELRLGLAAIGARDLDGNQGFGLEYFQRAERLLSRPNAPTGLRRIQIEVLLIEFAGWPDNKALRNWATKASRRVASAISSLQNELPESPQNSWTQWIYAEELKRTIFAFYCITIQLAVLHGLAIPLAARYLGLTFPCSDDCWEARDEKTCADCMAWRPYDMLTFSTATHGFLVGDPGLDTQELQARSPFSQHILLCGILEAIETASRMPVNYSMLDDWLPGSISNSAARVRFTKALTIWYSLYISPENKPPDKMLWRSGDIARAREEVMMLLMLGTDRLIEVNSSMDTGSARIAAKNAVDLLHQLALAGFYELIERNDHLPLSPTGLEIAALLARATITWLLRLHQTYANDPLPAEDTEIIGKLQLATAEAARSIPHAFVSQHNQPPASPGLLDLRMKVMDVWSHLLGGQTWIERDDGPTMASFRSLSISSV